MKIKILSFLGISMSLPLLAVACTTNTENNTSSIDTNLDPNKNLKFEDISNNISFKNIAKGQDNSILAVTNDNRLMRYKNNAWTDVATNINPNSPILENRGRISAVDTNSNYIMISGSNVTKTNIKVSLLSSFVHLGAATIMVVNENNKYYLARLELGSTSIGTNINKNIELLPDSKPVQISLGSSNNSDGSDIAVIATPSDASDYQHGVLGDKIEGKTVFLVERHNMNDIRGRIDLTDNSVFEESRLVPIKINNKYYLVTVLSGENGKGARIAILEQKGNKLEIAGKGPQLDANKWMSFYVGDDKDLYVNNTPHIGGETLKYDLSDLSNIKTQPFTTEVSSHEINSFNHAISVVSNKYVFTPSADYKSVVAINIQTKTKEVVNVETKIKKLVFKSNRTVYALLDNDKIVAVQFA